jgi:hypothetical protein
MNPQPQPYVGDLFALLFGALICYYALKAFYKKNPEVLSDMFVLGYIEDSASTVNNIHISSLNSKQDIESQQLYNDCVEALRALGMKKSEATRVTKRVFSSNQIPQSVQEFLLIALKK